MEEVDLINVATFDGELTAYEMDAIKGGGCFGLAACCNFIQQPENELE